MTVIKLLLLLIILRNKGENKWMVKLYCYILGPMECLSRARNNYLDHFEWYSLFGDLLNPPLRTWDMVIGGESLIVGSLHLSVVDLILSNSYK